MIQRKSNSLGIDFNYQVAGTHEEYNSLAKRVDEAKNPIDACLEDAVEHIVQHSMNTVFRDLFLHGREVKPATENSAAVEKFDGLEQITGIKRATEDVKSPTKADPNRVVQEYSEKEGAYFKRVCAEKGVKPDHFTSLAQAAADQVKFDPSAPEPTTRKPASVPKIYLEKADKVIADGKTEKALAKIQKDIGQTIEITGDAAKDREPLGRLIKAHADWIALKQTNY